MKLYEEGIKRSKRGIDPLFVKVLRHFSLSLRYAMTGLNDRSIDQLGFTAFSLYVAPRLEFFHVFPFFQQMVGRGGGSKPE